MISEVHTEGLESKLARTVHDYFIEGYRRTGRTTLRDFSGTAVQGSEDLSAAFQLFVREGTVTRVEYRCSSCVTLVALCEHVAQHLVGQPVEIVRALGTELLATWHPEVPRSHQNRSSLVIRAVRCAFDQIQKQEPT